MGGGCGGLEGTYFSTVSNLGEGVVVFKELFGNSFNLWGGCGGVERTDSKNCFVTVSTYGQGVWWCERTDSKNFFVTVSTYGQGVVVLKKQISNSFNFGGRVWWC